MEIGRLLLPSSMVDELIFDEYKSESVTLCVHYRIPKELFSLYILLLLSSFLFLFVSPLFSGIFSDIAGDRTCESISNLSITSS